MIHKKNRPVSGQCWNYIETTEQFVTQINWLFLYGRNFGLKWTSDKKFISVFNSNHFNSETAGYCCNISAGSKIFVVK